MRLYAPEVYVETDDVREAKRLLAALQKIEGAEQLATAWANLRPAHGIYRLAVDTTQLPLVSQALRKARWTKAADLGELLNLDPLDSTVPRLLDLK